MDRNGDAEGKATWMHIQIVISQLLKSDGPEC